MAYTLDQVRQAYRAAVAANQPDDAERILQVALKMAQQQAPDEHGLYDPSEGMSGGAKAVAGYSRGVRNVGRHAANLVGLMSDEAMADANRLDAPLMRHGSAQLGSAIGEAVVTAPVMAGGAGLAGRTALGARMVANPIARGAIEGLAQGALMADPGQKGEGALLGGALGAALPTALAGGSKLVRGMTRTPEAEALLRQGVDLTPGQMNPHGWFNAIEESWQSTPGIGPLVRGARDNAVRDWQRLVVQQAAAPGQTIAKGAGQEMLDTAYRGFDAAYDPAKGFPVGAKIMSAAGPDMPLPQAFAREAAKSRLGLEPAARANVGDWAQTQLNELIQEARRSGRGLTSDDLIRFRSMLRTAARDAGGLTQPERAQQALLADIEKQITAALDSQLPGSATAALRAADDQYAKYKIVERAMARAGDQASGMTPAKLEAAIKSATGPGEFARGGGLLRDVERQGRAAFEQVSPPTGARLASIGLPVAAVTANPSVGLPLAGGVASLVGTRTGRRLAQGMTPQQQRVAALVDAMRRQAPEMAWQAGDEYLQRLLVASGQR